MNSYQHLIHKEITIKFYAVIVALFMIALLVMVVIVNKTRLNQYKNQVKILSEKIADIKSNYSIAQTAIEHLRKKTAEIEKILHFVPPSPDLKLNSFQDPISHIRKDLVKRSDLIPFEGVLGGTMGFYDENRIHILNYKWVYAHFEDGHIGGEMLLEYGLSEDGKINWKVIASDP